MAHRVVVNRLQRPFRTEIVPGIEIMLDGRHPHEAVSWWQGRRYESPTVPVLLKMLEGGERFFDMGANYGFFSYFALAASSVEVHAFEPNPELHRRMAEAAVANGLCRFHPERVGLAEEAGELAFNLCEWDPSFSTFGPHPSLQATLINVPVVSFDQWRRTNGLDLPASPLWIAKIDVEGFETRVLRGMREALEASAFRGLVVELNEYTLRFCGSSVAQLHDMLLEHGFRRQDCRVSRECLNGYYLLDR